MSDPTGWVLTVQDPPCPCLASGTTNHICPRAATPPAPYEIPLPSSSLPLKARLQLKLQGWVRCPTPGCCWTKVFGFFLLKTCSAQREEEHQVCSNSVSLGMSPRVSWVRDEVLAPKPPHRAGGVKRSQTQTSAAVTLLSFMAGKPSQQVQKPLGGSRPNGTRRITSKPGWQPEMLFQGTGHQKKNIHS